jgi:N-acetylglucosaminyl-diphospho-decaprenol L-rhamnosyltransferase
MTPGSRDVPVTVIIVTFASQDVIGRTLAALAPGHGTGLFNCVVIDNASPDGTREVVAACHPWVRLIASPKNLGYGRACNLGFHEVTTPYALFMNPDVELKPDGIARLLRQMEERPRAGVLAPATRIGGEYQFAGGLPTAWSIARNALGVVGARVGSGPILPGMAPYSTDWLCGAVMLVRSAMFRAIGGFDPTFFLYFEETDLCARMLQAGFELWATGDVEAVHAGGTSSKKLDPALRDGVYVVEHFFASQYYYLKKHHGAVAAAAVETTELACKALRDVGRTVLRRPSKHELRMRLRGPIFTCPPAVT